MLIPGLFHQTAAHSFAASGSTGLRTNMVGYWEFENTSWLDSHTNGMTLTQHGTPSPTSVTGKVGNAASFIAADTQYLSRADETAMYLFNTDFSACIWAKAADLSKFFPMTKMDLVTDGNGFSFRYNYTTASRGALYLSADWESQFTTDTYVDIGDSGWHFYVIMYDLALKKGGISVDGNPIIWNASSMTNAFHSNVNGLADLQFGWEQSTYFHDGQIDQAGLWIGRKLTIDDIGLLYNGGAGLSYAGTA